MPTITQNAADQVVLQVSVPENKPGKLPFLITVPPELQGMKSKDYLEEQ